MFVTVKKMHDEAKDLLLRAMITNNLLQILESSVNEEKISFQFHLTSFPDVFVFPMLFRICDGMVFSCSIRLTAINSSKKLSLNASSKEKHGHP